MNKKIKVSSIIGVVFVSALGTFLHYLFDLSGGNTYAALISGVNESTWEHLKLFYIPFFIYTLIECAIWGKRSDGFFTSKLLSAILGMGVLTVGFYTYTGILGYNIAWLNIALFYLGVIAAYLLSYKLLTRVPKKDFRKWEMLSALLLVAIAAVFFIFTFYPPKIGLFQDPVTKNFGIFR